MPRWLRALFLVGVIAASSAEAATRYVDGGCSASGANGTYTNTTCGHADGPARTVNEGIEPMVSGDILNIRGSHADHGGSDCDNSNSWEAREVGRYFEQVYMDTGAPAGFDHGDAVDCAVGSRCIIRGCPASDCGSDE